MNLLLICFIAFAIAIVVFGIILVIMITKSEYWDYDKEFLQWLIPLIIGVFVWVGGIFVGLDLNTNDHKAYAQKYLAQKQTIEMSLKNENLSGLEKIELVKQATTLNGEITERKTRIKYWNAGVLDNTIYDEIELIDLG